MKLLFIQYIECPYMLKSVILVMKLSYDIKNCQLQWVKILLLFK